MSNVDTAKSAIQAFSQGDLAALKECHSEDAVYELRGFVAPRRWYSLDEVRPGWQVRGRDAIVDILVRLPDHWSTVITEPSEYIDGGEYVGVLGTLRFANSKVSDEFPFVLVLRFDCDGKVMRAEFHGDSAELASLETEPPQPRHRRRLATARTVRAPRRRRPEVAADVTGFLQALGA